MAVGRSFEGVEADDAAVVEGACEAVGFDNFVFAL